MAIPIPALSFPLMRILAADDQQESLCSFVAKALDDLKTVGLFDVIQQELQKALQTTSQ